MSGEAWVEENDPGQVASDTPLLLVQGGQDPVVVPARTAALYDRLCEVGQVGDRVVAGGRDVDLVDDLAGDDITAWLAARFAGDPAPDDC